VPKGVLDELEKDEHFETDWTFEDSDINGVDDDFSGDAYST
jgi:hypothetical protein